MSRSFGSQKSESVVTEPFLAESPTTFYTRRAKVTLLGRFGWYSIVALCAGTALILGCAGFICFLWMANDQNYVWRQIVLAGWTSRSITIAALILRFAVTTQAAVCTSMLAALFLNSFRVPLPNAAAVSLARYSNSGPRSLLAYLPKGKNIKSLSLGLIVLCLTLSTFLLQFTSTALLSDVDTGLIAVSQSIPSLPYGINSSSLVTQQVDNTGYLGTKPIYPAFAEYSEAPTLIDGVSDTGLSLRAFLPIDPLSSRELLLNYSGMATVIDTRVVCMRPSISNIHVSAILSDPTISGLVSTKLNAPRFNRTSSKISETPFNCTFAVQGFWSNFYASTREWPLVMCRLNINDSGIISEMDPLILPPSIGFNPGEAFLLINTTGTMNDWGPINNKGGNLPITLVVLDGEWAILRTNVSAISLSLTLCYTTTLIQDTFVEAWRRAENTTEASFGWDTKNATFDTQAIRRQLGATSSAVNPKDRVSFNLAAKGSWLKAPALNYTATGWTSVNPPTRPELLLFYSENGSDDPDTPVLLCGYCQPGGKITTSRAQSAVFGDILQDTGNPALAVQAFITTLFGMSYYDHLFQFDVAAPAVLVSNTLVILPTGYKFLAAVLIVTAMHIFLVALVTLIFTFWGTNSLLGSAWPAVAQLLSAEINPWLSRASDMKDGDVKKAMLATGKEDTLVGISNSGDRLQVTSRGQQSSRF